MVDGHQLADLVRVLMAEHGLTALGWVFTLDDSVARAGCCRHGDKTVSLSKHILGHELPDVRNILLHEIAHALAGPGEGHGKKWREIAVRIGSDGHRCHGLELRPYAQAMTCVLCGLVNAVRHRVCRDYWRGAKCTSCAAVGSIVAISRETAEAIQGIKGKMFAEDLLTAVTHVTDSAFVAVGRSLFDGRDEDVAHVEELALRFPSVGFVWFDVPEELRATPVVLHNRARLAARDAALAVSPSVLKTGWVMMIDGDEVPRDGGRPLSHWWATNRDRLDLGKAYKLSNRWFFLHPRLVSERTEDSIVLIHGSHMTDAALAHPRERDGVCMTLCEGGGSCVRGVPGPDGTPMFDHFSWVRESRVLLLAKVSNWGHSGERDWVALVDRAWCDMEQGRLPDRDFVHGRRLSLLEPGDD